MKTTQYYMLGTRAHKGAAYTARELNAKRIYPEVCSKLKIRTNLFEGGLENVIYIGEVLYNFISWSMYVVPLYNEPSDSSCILIYL